MTSQTHFPPLDQLLTQEGEMLLLDRVATHDSDQTVCRAHPRTAEWLFEPDGKAPSWLSLEYMAQCAAVHGNLLSRARGERVYPGLLLGSRQLRLRLPFLEPELELEVSARLLRRGDLAVFDCEVRSPHDGDWIARARLNVLRMRDLEFPTLGETH